MELWPRPEYHDPAWEVDKHPLAERAFNELLVDGRYQLEDSWGRFDSDVLASRVISYPFYRDALSVEMLIGRPFEEGVVLGSWLVCDDAESKSGVRDSGTSAADEQGEADKADASPSASVFHLNGTSPPIHEFNAKLPIVLDNADIAQAYLKFFCAHVWGDEGGFWVCSDKSDIPFEPGQETGKAVTGIEDMIVPPRYKGRNEQQHWLFDATILYSTALFSGSFAIQPSGMIEMLDDEPIVADLPIVPDRRIKGMRGVERAVYLAS